MSKLNWNAQAPKMTQTENGALAFASTGHPLTDFFASFGAMRLSSEGEIVNAFVSAANYNLQDAVKLLFFFRDCRGGQGEKRIFEIVYKSFIDTDHPIGYQMLEFVPEYGSWKDVVKLAEYAHSNNINFFNYASGLYANKILEDATSENMSLAAKYAPDQNYKNKKFFNAFFYIARKVLNIDRKGYRQLLSAMRKALNVVETKMSANRWDRINFESVPSVAHKNYRKAFGKHQQERYAAYLKSVKKGEKVIKAGVLTPVDIIKKYMNTSGDVLGYGVDETLELQWKALIDYVNCDVLTISDTSGSMSGEPMLVSVALGIYFAQRSKGAFKNEVISFNESPAFVSLEKCKTLYDCIVKMGRIDWGGNTDFTKVFDKILETAKKNKLNQEDLPKFVLCISDMQFDRANGRNTKTPFGDAEEKFKAAGYEMPKMIFWNVRESAMKNFPSEDKNGVFMVSGYSPTVLQYVLAAMNGRSYDAVMEVISNPRYSFVETLPYFS